MKKCGFCGAQIEDPENICSNCKRCAVEEDIGDIATEKDNGAPLPICFERWFVTL